jgi:hypothetical protein
MITGEEIVERFGLRARLSVDVVRRDARRRCEARDEIADLLEA